MPRRHVINPTVTVIMETRGSRPDKIVRAINSFIAQEYRRATLLILNYHPTPLKLSGVPPDASIEVMNCEDHYVRHVYQHMHNLSQVRTDCWTILDDDDWLERDHLSQLVEKWNEATDRTDAPLQVCGQGCVVHYETEVKIQQFKGWAVSLFERMTPEEIDWCFKLFPPDVNVGSDTWIAWNSFFDKRLFDGRPTYNWDRIGSDHISQHETNRGDTELAKFNQTMRFWKLKMDARAVTPAPIVLGKR